MNFRDSGIIISQKKYSENDAIVKVFCANHGVFKGFVSKINSRKNKMIFQVGNIISFEWRSRSEDGLGSFYYTDLEQSVLSKIIFEKLKLNCVIAIFSIIENCFLEREHHGELYSDLLDFMKKINTEEVTNHELMIDYVRLELKLLEVLGYGVDLSCCAVSNVYDNLAFVSPRSGRAVSKEVGEPYKERLLRLPQFLLDGFVFGAEKNMHKENVAEEIKSGMILSGYFLEKFIFSQNKNLNFAARKLIERDFAI